MYKFFKNKQANHNGVLPALFFKGRPLLPAVNALLHARGIEGDAAARVFFDPHENDLQDALRLKNIDAAARRIKAAADGGEVILVYGDYDADGICAASILYLYLKGLGAEVTAYIPGRDDGYGLTTETIERLAEERAPDLFITCDCGISNAAEAEYILDLGMDVIITDHHDLPEVLPDCIVVSPKLTEQEYSYPYLCGAGVAFMLVWAMGGREAALPYLPYAAVATIGDMVPLTGDNRIITRLGLKMLNAAPPPWLAMLAEACGISFPLTAQDIAYRIVPRINASGRMARAADAFDFIVSGDPVIRAEFLAKIEDAAARRKTASDRLFADAAEALAGEKAYDAYALVLSSDTWEKGVTGIAAAQLAGAFNRPVFLMAKTESGKYKGTARGIDGVNVREALAAVSEHLIEYGGHCCAAGFSLQGKNIPLFKASILRYFGENAGKDLFSHRQSYDAEISAEEITPELARQLKLFEPSGTGNRSPLFRLKTEKMSVTAMKNKPEHITVCAERGASILGFNCHRLSDIMRSCAQKELLLEIKTGEYMGREELSVILRHTSCPVFADDLDAQKTAAAYIAQGALAPPLLPRDPIKLKTYLPQELKGLADSGGRLYGLLVIASAYASYKAFSERFDPRGENFLHEYLYPSCANNYNRLILAPQPGAFDMRFYHTVIFLDAPFDRESVSRLAVKGGADIYLPQGGASPAVKELAAAIDLSREAFGRYYRLFAALKGTAADPEALFEAAAARNNGIFFSQFMVCLYVFAELGLLEYGAAKPLALPPVKAELADSRIYCLIKEMQER